nr:hypothetical protein [Tanacetum cinerariifolium]
VYLELQDLLELLDPHKCRHHLLHLHPPTKKSPDDEDIKNAHIPKVNLRASTLASTYSPPLEDSLLTQIGDIAMFMDRFCKRQRINELKPQDLEGPAFELVEVFRPNVIHLQYQIEECHKLLTDSMDDSILKHNVNLEYLRYGSKGSRHALSISKMKAAYYPDVGLEQMVPIRYGLKRSASMIFLLCMVFLTGGSKDNDSTLIDTHLRVIAKLVDLNEHIIVERDFKYLYPSNFKDLYLLNLQGHLNHLPPKDKKILTTAVNLWTRYLVINQRVKDFQLGIESYQTQLNLTKP